MTSLKQEYLAKAVDASSDYFRATGVVTAADDLAAAVLLARDLTTGEESVLKRGYTVRNAALAAADVFGVDPDRVEAELAGQLADRIVG